MPDIPDATTIASLAVALAFFLWAVTQIHLLRVARRIHADIDAKRTDTQLFVDSRLAALETKLGGFEARMTAQIPPNTHGELAALNDEMKRRLEEIDRGLTAALTSIDNSFKGLIGNLGQSELELRKELGAVDAEGRAALDEAVAQADIGNPVVRRLYAWAAKPVDPKLEAKNPIGAVALQLGKAALLDRLQDGGVQAGTPAFLKRAGSWSPGLK